MKESLWGYWIIVLGVSIIAIMILLQNYSITDEQSFFLAKENLSSSMKEAVDFAYTSTVPDPIYISPDGSSGNYKSTTNHAVLKINAEKAVENFIRRFADTVDVNKTYKINFYMVSEAPPAMSVEVLANTSGSGFGQWQAGADTSAVTSSRFTGILFTTELYNPCWDQNNDGVCDS